MGLYYLSRGQLVILAGGFTVTSVVVFFLGVFIGQGIEERKLLKNEEPLVKIPVAPLLQGSGAEPSAKEEITFYDTLAKVPKEEGATRSETDKASAKPAKVSDAEPEPASRDKETTGAAAKAREPSDRAPWTVQVNAFPRERDADRLAKRLKDRGYDAYVVVTEIRGKTWYRVRVGHFGTRAEAKALQEDLKAKENLTQSIAVSR